MPIVAIIFIVTIIVIIEINVIISTIIIMLSGLNQTSFDQVCHHLKNLGLMDTWWNFIISETVFIMMRNKIRFSKGADVTKRHI